MIARKLTTFLSGPCRHCGKPAGFLRRAHDECAQIQRASWNEMVMLAAWAAGIPHYNEDALRAGMGGIARRTYHDKPSMLNALVDGWLIGMRRPAECGTITPLDDTPGGH